MNTIGNKNIFLAEKILDFLQNRHRLIIFLATEPDETLTISENFLPDLFPDMSKEEIAQGFLSLERLGVLEYENWKDTYKEYYDQIKFFDIIPKKDKLSHFISTAKTNSLGFKLSDEEYKKELIEILEKLVNSETDKIKISEFGQKNSLEILQKISDFSDSIKIEETLDIDFERGNDGEVVAYGGGYFPNTVTVKDREKLGQVFDNIQKTIREIYEVGIKIFLDNEKQLSWRCKKCGRWLGNYTSPQDIMTLLDEFSSWKFKACHKCRTKNSFAISPDGRISFLAVDK